MALRRSIDHLSRVRAWCIPLADVKPGTYPSDTARLQLFIDAVTDYAIFMLSPEGLVASWNSGAQRIKGYAAAEIIGQHFSRFYTESARAAGEPERALRAATQTGKHEAEGWRVRKDGSRFWASVVIDAIRDERGTLVGFVKIMRDISERREAQLALQRAQEKLSYAQKMDALGQLTGGVAHDFNNLLMIISGHLRIIKKLIDDDQRGLQAIDAIETATRRGETLTRQLLTFSRRQQLNPTVIDIGERIAAMRSVLSNSLRNAIQLKTSTEPGIWPVEVDAAEFELALVNIAVNSRDAMPGGGIISISAENVRLERGQVAGDLAGEFVALTVADSGSGIPTDILPKVFDPFFTTKRIDKGTGLGLSQVYGFAHQSGGTVTIDSEVGKGTRLTIYLPRAKSGAARRAIEQPAEEIASGGLVLLVEDNPVVADVSATMLGELGFGVETVADATAALRALEAGKQFELMFSDIVMAGQMDGIALARVVRQRRPDLPILLATGYSRAADAAQDEFSILRKPYQITQLGRAIAAVIAQTRAHAAGNGQPLGSGARR
jgi:PAS domain S-box-containing protein